MRPQPTHSALVLSGGGARGAYQVGVLRGLVDLGVISHTRSPFDILVGASAGAINAAMLAANTDRPADGVDRLVRVWSRLRAQQVFRTDLRSLGGIGARWVRDLSFGGVLHRVTPKSLLDTAPLHRLLAQRIPFERIDTNIDTGALYALTVLATDLYTSHGVVFVHGAPAIPLWRRSWLRVERARIGVEHLMASSAIPIFFPSVEIAGRHFGDGCIRNTAPLSSAINLGADRIVAIGVRGPDHPRAHHAERLPPPTVAQIAGVLLDAVMLDAIEVDVEHSERVNASVVACRNPERDGAFRWVDVLCIRPSESIAAIAAEMEDRVPAVLRYLMRGLGTDQAITELVSYLLFEAAFCRRLIDLGRADVEAAREQIESFFSGTARLAARERAAL
jgi:NTE family protein